MKSWFDTKSEWFIDKRLYLYKDALRENFLPIFDEKLNKTFYKFIPSDFDIALVEAIATEKSKYTNDQNQYGVKKRTSTEKVNKQFEGCLAELAVAKFLIQIFNEESKNVHIYDAERPNFIYDANAEYDVKVIRNGIEKKCEVRNSWSYKTELREFCEKYDVLGSYVNSLKLNETLADFFFRPVLQLNNKQNTIPKNTIELIKNKQVTLFLVAACTKEKMIELGARNSTLSKGTNTNYFATKINKLDCITSFENDYNNMFK